MRRSEIYEIHNRDAQQMYEYWQARIDSMKHRIVELQSENAALRQKQFIQEPVSGTTSSSAWFSPLDLDEFDHVDWSAPLVLL
jgi:hypothetical protein